MSKYVHATNRCSDYLFNDLDAKTYACQVDHFDVARSEDVVELPPVENREGD